MDRVLGLFAKWPQPGYVKTRLAAATSEVWAAEVALAFLQDLTGRLSPVPARRVLAFAPTDAGPLFAGVVRDRFTLAPQADGDLGRRLSTFLGEQFAAGAGSVVVLGSDSPTVPLAYVEQAFAELERSDLVLGPATDGGYYLIGCARRVPPIFDGVAWGGPTVLAETVARLAEPSWRLALLPPWYDVDSLEDWRMLCGHVAALRRAGLDPGVPHTERLCREGQP
jgi:rSAM/selenodomain-associated transferase 1